MSEKGDISDFKEEEYNGNNRKLTNSLEPNKNIPVKTQIRRMDTDLEKVRKDLEEYKKNNNMLKGELISLEGRIKEKCNELCKSIIDDLSNFKKDFNRVIVSDKTETNLFKAQVNVVNEDKIKLQKETLSLQSRMRQCEIDVGVEYK